MSKPVSTFVVLFHGRTGSSHLISLLGSRPDIRTSGEILVGHRNVEKQIARATSALSVDPDSPFRAVGFKTKFKDVLDFEAFGTLLHKLDCRIIYLNRRNWVKWAVSWQNMVRLHQSLGKWNLDPQDQKPGPIEIDLENFDKALARIPDLLRRTEDEIRSIDLPTLRLDYEQLLVAPQPTLTRIFSFLDVEPAEVRSKVRKATSDDLRKGVRNFDELRKRYAGTVYESMFDEVLVPGSEG